MGDDRVLSVGRCPEGEKGLLCWTGSAVIIRARMNSWSAIIEADWNVNTPWMGILVDGAPVSRFALGKGKREYILLTGMDETVEHELTLFRDTQPMSGEEKLNVRVWEMEIDGELETVQEKPHIEVIGDSLTTGEGTVGPETGMEWRSLWLSGMQTWAQSICRNLNVWGEWVSQSGWGLYTSWDNNPDAVLGNIYESVWAHSPYSAVQHDFAGHPVGAVIINLGTNDWNALKNMPEEERPSRVRKIHEAARNLLRQIHRCRPGTPVLFAYGMCDHSLSECLQTAVQEDALEADGLSLFLELPLCAEQELGSRGHPGAEYQRRCGLLIADFLREKGIF